MPDVQIRAGGFAIPQIGELSIPCTLERRHPSQDARGGVPLGDAARWDVITSEIWVRDRATPRSVLVADGTFVFAIEHRITLRYRPGVLPGMRLTAYDGAHWYIQTVSDPDGQKTWLLLTCTELPAR